MCSLKPVLLYHVGTEEFFDPTVDASCMNTYTKRDHVFAKLNVQLQRGTVTLLHKEQSAAHASESAFMQLEFSGTAQSQLCPSQCQHPVCFHHLGQLVNGKVGWRDASGDKSAYGLLQKICVWFPEPMS